MIRYNDGALFAIRLSPSVPVPVVVLAVVVGNRSENARVVDVV